MDTRGGVEPDWTKRYRLVAGVYAMRDGYILMLERARGMMIGFWSVPGVHLLTSLWTRVGRNSSPSFPKFFLTHLMRLQKEF
jgi:hypothetical protein